MDDFIVVYIFRESANAIFGEDIFRLLIGCIALIIGIVLFKQAKDEQSKPMAMFRAVFVLFWAFVWISIHGLILVSQINEYSKVVRIYKNHTYSLAEGTVEVVHQEPAGGHDKGDIILVDGKRFEFSYYAHSFY